MFAVLQIGSSQFRVAEGDTIQAEGFSQQEGKNVTLDKVLMFAKGSDIRIGQPYLKDVKVKAKVIKRLLGRKIISLKYRRRKSSSTKKGHRQKLAVLNITQIAA